jgi:transcriptional regulator with XRE-family HTH domain
MDARHYYPKKLATLREGEGLSQEALAVALDVHRLTIQRAETGRCASYGLLLKYATRYDLAVTKLIRPRPVELAEIAA